MKSLLSIILLGLISQQAFSFSDVQEQGYLRVAVYKNYAPFSFRENGQLKGIEVDLGKLLAKKLGVDPLIWAIGADENMEDDLRNTIWKGHYLGGGTADVMLHAPINDAFSKANDRVIFNNPYFKEEVVAVRHNSKASTPLLKLFADRAIGVELDTLPDFYLVGAMGGRFRDNVVHFATVELAVKAMQAGEVSSVVAPRSQIEFALASSASEYWFSSVSMPASYQSSWVVGMAVKAGRQDLVDQLSIALDELKASGELSALYKKYNTSYIEP
ncbi:MAG: ABC transporter substrate-binding protein [Piscirickettsiaceae bacterium]|nr:MAG: ABC transporter substrate-binding protein [Piscirickettsiaceae bacterium]